jgi:hypothetical protein
MASVSALALPAKTSQQTPRRPWHNLVTTGINIRVEDDPLTAIYTTQNDDLTRYLGQVSGSALVSHGTSHWAL